MGCDHFSWYNYLVKRSKFIARIHAAFHVNPVVALLGPRQCGKTTLAREFAGRRKNITFFDLENSRDLARLEDPLLALEGLAGWVVIDEIQRLPRLFETLRVLADRPACPARFLILGSASRDLIRQSSESLAGRISYLELTPFNAQETGPTLLRKLWLRGGFPRSFLANTAAVSAQWRDAYVSTFLERDLPSLGVQIPARSMRRFWMMLAHYHGQIFNASEIGRSLGMAHTTVERYLDILVGTFMIRRLNAWTENIAKRQVKASKIYFRDSGIYHTLLGLEQEKELDRHPKLGASWEGFALEQIIAKRRAASKDVYFWATHNEAELDLLVIQGGKRIGYEVKYTSKPRLTPSMRIAMNDLKLSQLNVIYPGTQSFALAKGIHAVGFETM